MELIHDEMSEQILVSAKKLAREKNVEQITVRDILEDLDITNRVFYNRYHNIEEVMDILYSETVLYVRESLAISWQDKAEFWDHVESVAASTLILSYESRQYISQFIFGADSSKESNYRFWNDAIAELIRRGQGEGFIKADLDVEAVSYSIWCFIRGFNADAMARKLPKEEALNSFRIGFGCFLDGMKPTGVLA